MVSRTLDPLEGSSSPALLTGMQAPSLVCSVIVCFVTLDSTAPSGSFNASLLWSAWYEPGWRRTGSARVLQRTCASPPHHYRVHGAGPPREPQPRGLMLLCERF